MSVNPAMTFARAVVAALAANGVRDIVLCPGSRSGPLAHALVEAAADVPPPGAPEIRLHVRIDERSAGFVGLGLAIARGSAAVVTTSGTAVGNLLPAAMEAHHSGVRLFLVTADRPFDLRATGANQTTRQPGLFGSFVRWSGDAMPPGEGRDLVGEAVAVVEEAVAHAVGARGSSDVRDGPVHLNLQFREPLGPDRGAWPEVAPVDVESPPEPPAPPLPEIERGVVVAGDRAGPAAAAIALARGWPLLAEPSSGSRLGAAAVPGYASLLATAEGRELADGVEFALVLGRPTLSRAVRGLIGGAPRLWVARHGSPWREAPMSAEVVVPDVPFDWVRAARPPVDAPWQRRWLDAAAPPDASRWNLLGIASILAEEPGDDPIVLGSSGAVRAADAVFPARPLSNPRMIVSNRGLSGIDGTVSTAVGLALGLGRPVTALLGDLTFLHDVGGLLVGRREQRPDLRIVVANDGGGTIFAQLEHAEAGRWAFDRAFTAPHGADLRSLATGFGATHAEVRSLDELREALSSPPSGVDVVEAALV